MFRSPEACRGSSKAEKRPFVGIDGKDGAQIIIQKGTTACPGTGNTYISGWIFAAKEYSNLVDAEAVELD